MFIKSAEAISLELTAAMQRYIDQRLAATRRLKDGGNVAAQGIFELISATGQFATDLSALLGDALDTISVLAEMLGQHDLAVGPGAEFRSES